MRDSDEWDLSIVPYDKNRLEHPWWAGIVGVAAIAAVLFWMSTTGHSDAVFGVLLVLFRLFAVFGGLLVLPLFWLYASGNKAITVPVVYTCVWLLAFVIAGVTADMSFT